MGRGDFADFEAFWPYYLHEHGRPLTRGLHYAGTSLVVGIVLAAALSGRWGWLIGVPLAGYGFAWAAHLLVERNRPATFRHPWWSLRADFRMWWWWLTGRMAGAC